MDVYPGAQAPSKHAPVLCTASAGPDQQQTTRTKPITVASRSTSSLISSSQQRSHHHFSFSSISLILLHSLPHQPSSQCPPYSTCAYFASLSTVVDSDSAARATSRGVSASSESDADQSVLQLFSPWPAVTKTFISFALLLAFLRHPDGSELTRSVQAQEGRRGHQAVAAQAVRAADSCELPLVRSSS